MLCDLEIWHTAPNGLLRSLLEHLLELASESTEKRSNIRIMRDLQLVSKLLHIITDIQDNGTRDILFGFLTILLGGQPRHSDLLLFGQFIAAKLPQIGSDSEKSIDLSKTVSMTTTNESSGTDDQHAISANIILRNRCLALLHSLLFTNRNTVNHIVCEDISRILGMDWILLFLQPHVHSSSVILGMRILVVLCANETLIGRFKDGVNNGGYLRYTEFVSQSNKIVLGQPQLTPSPASGSNSVVQVQPGVQLPAQIASEVKTSVLHVPGFQYLEWLLPYHLDIPELYFLLTAIIMGQPIKLLGSDHTKLDLDRVWAFLWGAPVSQTPVGSIGPKVNLCPEAVCVLLKMVRTIVHSETNTDWLQSHPVTIFQVLFSLYHNLPDFMSVIMTADVINAMAGVLFPLPNKEGNESEPNSGASTPDDPSGSMVVVPRHVPQLTQNPVRKFVIDFLRVIVVDSLSLSLTSKTTPVIDLVLDASPDNSELPQQIAFQTEIISALMDHLLAADVLVGEQAALPIVPLLQSHVQNIAPNVFYLTARIVDKMWQGYLSKDPHEVFDFIIKLIGQAKRRSSSLTLEQLHHSLNRIILYLLSRPTESVAEQMAVLEALHKLTTHRLLIFGAGNHELEFIGCLTYCLLQLTSDLKIVLEVSTSNRNTTWHVNPSNEVIESRDDFLNQHQGRNLIVGAAHRVWEELYVCKKPAIEEVFKITLCAPGNSAKAPNLSITREQVIDSATKLWYNFVDAERKSSYRVPWELHNQIQSKIQKVTGGLTRLASRTKVKKDDFAKSKTRVIKTKAFQWTGVNVALVKDLWDLKCIQQIQVTQHTHRYVCQDWLQSEKELIRERGLWGPVKVNRIRHNFVFE